MSKWLFRCFRIKERRQRVFEAARKSLQKPTKQSMPLQYRYLENINKAGPAACSSPIFRSSCFPKTSRLPRCSFGVAFCSEVLQRDRPRPPIVRASPGPHPTLRERSDPSDIAPRHACPASRRRGRRQCLSRNARARRQSLVGSAPPLAVLQRALDGRARPHGLGLRLSAAYGPPGGGRRRRGRRAPAARAAGRDPWDVTAYNVRGAWARDARASPLAFPVVGTLPPAAVPRLDRLATTLPPPATYRQRFGDGRAWGRGAARPGAAEVELHRHRSGLARQRSRPETPPEAHHWAGPLEKGESRASSPAPSEKDGEKTPLLEHLKSKSEGRGRR